jgi:hypothetical protein
VHPPPSPARTDFTLITECTPESGGFNSVYSGGGIKVRMKRDDVTPNNVSLNVPSGIFKPFDNPSLG